MNLDNLNRLVYYAVSRNRRKIEKYCKKHKCVLNEISESGIYVTLNKNKEKVFIPMDSIEF